MTIAELFAKLKIEIDQGSLAEVDKAIGSLKTALTGLAVYVSADYLSGLVMSTVEAGGHIHTLAQSAGVTMGALQELGYAAQLNASSMDGMADGLGHLSRTMAEAKAGGEAQQKTFRDMGVAYRNADGTLRATEDVLADIADHIQSMPDGAAKTALSMDALGKSGKDLIPTLNGGSVGLAAMATEARDLGIVMDDKTAVALDDFGSSVDKIKRTLTGLKNRAIAALLPGLQKLADAFFVWYKINKDWLNLRLAQVFGAIGIVIGGVADLVGYLSGHFDTLLYTIGVFALTVAPSLLAAFAPIALAVGLFAALYIGVDDLVHFMRGDGSLIGDLLDEWFGEGTASNVRVLITDIGGGLKAAFTATLDYLEAKLQWIIDKIEWARGVAGDILETLAPTDPATVARQQIIAESGLQGLAAAEARGDFSILDSAQGLKRHDLITDAPNRYAAFASTPAVSSFNGGTPNQWAAAANNVTNTFHIDGSKDPETTANAVKLVLDRVFRQAAVGTGVAQ